VAAPSLALAGRLEAIPLADVLQVLATSEHDGVLDLEREDPPERAEIELVRGRVVRAELAHLPDRIGVTLLRRNLLHPDHLGEALHRQSAGYSWKPLGTVLLEMGVVEPGALAEAFAEQIGEQMAALLTWNRGVFRFRITPRSEIAPSRVVGVALDTRELLLDAARRCDEGSVAH
jgi:hypothetical protein